MVLKEILLDLPDNVCLAFVGDGPARQELEEHFRGLRVVFTVSSPCSEAGSTGRALRCAC